jgi:hypothetical protein
LFRGLKSVCWLLVYEAWFCWGCCSCSSGLLRRCTRWQSRCRRGWIRARIRAGAFRERDVAAARERGDGDGADERGDDPASFLRRCRRDGAAVGRRDHFRSLCGERGVLDRRCRRRYCLLRIRALGARQVDTAKRRGRLCIGDGERRRVGDRRTHEHAARRSLSGRRGGERPIGARHGRCFGNGGVLRTCDHRNDRNREIRARGHFAR